MMETTTTYVVGEDMTTTIQARIAELEKERDAFIAQANQQIAAYQGGIAELKRLIEKEKE